MVVREKIRQMVLKVLALHQRNFYFVFMLYLGLWYIKWAEPPWTRGPAFQFMPGARLGAVNTRKAAAGMSSVSVDTISASNHCGVLTSPHVTMNRWAPLVLRARVEHGSQGQARQWTYVNQSATANQVNGPVSWVESGVVRDTTHQQRQSKPSGAENLRVTHKTSI